MKIPVDKTGLTFMVMAEPRAKLDFESKQPVIKEGEQVHTVTVAVMNGAEVVQIRLSVPGAPGIGQAQWVDPVGLAFNLTDRPGQGGGGPMFWWTVDRLDALGGPSAPSGASAPASGRKGAA
ncbi:hypothetical protein LO762_10690 [Actinocorallia sp. API 0066]|uniref:hypothetical protein n=1 Tax=Actinocorallia sp. API 0066 TaxID=2896846 RepID=UPI001E2BC87D|nr:hypothetical protein [Actinocorallia sp. API 0066]MCD0449652.1 hypothetical protein [Actinocorallia sp. API 0066]